MPFDFFEESRRFHERGGAIYLSRDATLLYYVGCLSIANEQRREEGEWFLIPHAILRARCGILDKAGYWRARKEVTEKQFVEFANVGRDMIKFRILGTTHAMAYRFQYETEHVTNGEGVQKGFQSETEDVPLPVTIPVTKREPIEGKNVGGADVPAAPTKRNVTEEPTISPSPALADDGATSSVEEKEKALRAKAAALLSRYPPEARAVINEAFKVIASTRKYGTVAQSIITAELVRWAAHPVEVVVAGLRNYLDAVRGEGDPGRNERYAWGCIRNAARRAGSGAAPEERANGGPRKAGRSRATRSVADLKRSGWSPAQIAAIQRGVEPGQPGFPESA